MYGNKATRRSSNNNRMRQVLSTVANRHILGLRNVYASAEALRNSRHVSKLQACLIKLQRLLRRQQQQLSILPDNFNVDPIKVLRIGIDLPYNVKVRFIVASTFIELQRWYEPSANGSSSSNGQTAIRLAEAAGFSRTQQRAPRLDLDSSASAQALWDLPQVVRRFADALPTQQIEAFMNNGSPRADTFAFDSEAEAMKAVALFSEFKALMGLPTAATTTVELLHRKRRRIPAQQEEEIGCTIHLAT